MVAVTVQMEETTLALVESAPTDDVWTEEDLARYLREEVGWVKKNAKKRLIPGAFKSGRHWRFRRVEILKRIVTRGKVLLDPKERAK